jgi:hypothetical protein
VAIGATGLPSAGLWSRRKELVHHDHGHYWTSGVASKVIARWLGAPTASALPDRVAFEQAAPVDRVLAPERLLPEERHISERPLRS